MPVTVGSKGSKKAVLTPPLKWAGGKRWLVPYLREYWIEYSDRTLVEPLCGGIAVPLGLMPSRAILNDINPHVINFYHWLKKGLRITIPMKNDKEMYYRYRARFNELIGPLKKASSQEAAELFYYLNRTGYNGLCRFNQKGEFNVPFGRYKTINYAQDFLAYKEVFSRWVFTTGDFENVELQPTDFVYADPPYDVEFTQYSKRGFSWEDQVRLANWLAKHTGPVILSNQATPRITKLYEDLGFHLTFLEGPRRISCDGNRKPAIEILAHKM
ncbi:MAG: Dam family site-specific DNA-(adenine-N6)-methyltransferase [Firmicutes bacterium]|nr:Dam family site-specific DNA-(adenine-N6)-methyltransferase [Bacillota bacterium]